MYDPISRTYDGIPEDVILSGGTHAVAKWKEEQARRRKEDVARLDEIAQRRTIWELCGNCSLIAPVNHVCGQSSLAEDL